MAARSRPGLLVGAVLAVSLALRLIGLDWGLPHYDSAVMPNIPYRHSYHIDEDNFLWGLMQMRPAAGNFDVIDYHWGTLQHFLIYGVLLGGSAVGIVPAPWETAFARGDVEALPRLFVLGRLVSVAAGVAATLLVVALGALLGGRAAGLAAGLAYALAPFAVVEAHYLTNDITMSALLIGAVAAAARATDFRFWILDSGSSPTSQLNPKSKIQNLQWLTGAGLLLGLAVAAKYSALASAPLLLVAQWGAWRAIRRGQQGGPGNGMVLLLAPWLAAGGAFLLGEPYALLKPEAVLAGLQDAARGNAADLSGGLGGPLQMLRWQATNLAGLGLTWPPALLALGGLGVLAVRIVRKVRGAPGAGAFPWPAVILLAALGGLTVGVMLNRVFMLRYSQPLVPLLAVAAGVGWAAIPWRAVRGAAGALAIAVALFVTGGQLALLAGPHPANDLLAWLQPRLAPGQQVARLWPEYPVLDGTRYGLIRLDPWRPDIAADARPDYIIMDDMALGPPTPALAELLATHYRAVARFGARPHLGGFAWDEGTTPHDWKYSHPTFTVYVPVDK